MTVSRTFRFALIVTVAPDQRGYHDPEWIADAAWGSLTNEYGYECIIEAIEALDSPADSRT